MAAIGYSLYRIHVKEGIRTVAPICWTAFWGRPLGGFHRRASAGMSPNPRFFCQSAMFSAFSRVSAAGRKGGNRPRSVKKRARELPVWRISPPQRAFSCGKNGISLLKEIYFLPQRREFLAAKKFTGVWKAGKNEASGGFSFLIGGRPRSKSACLFASLSLHGLTRERHPTAQRAVSGGKVSPQLVFRLSSCIPVKPRESHIYSRPRPCARPHDSRGVGFDVLTKCNMNVRNQPNPPEGMNCPA